MSEQSNGHRADNTEIISPILLRKGDRIEHHGAVLEVAHIIEFPCEIEGGIRVVACISRLIGNETGRIPRQWFDTRAQLSAGGSEWAAALPEGLYWNVQGNAHASVSRIV